MTIKFVDKLKKITGNIALKRYLKKRLDTQCFIIEQCMRTDLPVDEELYMMRLHDSNYNALFERADATAVLLANLE